MKKILLAVLLVASIVQAQTSQDKVWDLLLKNKREDARKLFDKDLKKKKDTSAELVLLDAIIDVELGQSSFNSDFFKTFSKFPESKNLLYPVWYWPFGVGNVNAGGYDDYSYEKVDFVAGTEAYKNDLFVLYNKAIFDRRRRNYEGFSANIAKLGAIEKWQFCGVFENLNGSGLETEYEPEAYADNDKTFNANSNGIINWYNPAIPQKEGYHFYSNENEYGNGIIYAQTFINSPDDKTVVLNFSASGPLKIFVNDVEVYVNDKIESADLNAYKLKFNLKKGTNRLLLKSSVNGGNDYFFASIKDVNGNVVSGLEYFDTYKPYTKSTAADLNAEEVLPDFEAYLIKKCKEQPNNPLYAILLFNTLTDNHKDEQAFEALEKLSEKYPASSFLNTLLISHYTHTDDENKVEELKKNMMRDDENYYFSIISKFDDGNFLEESNLTELEKYKAKAAKLLTPNYAMLFDYIIALRNSDIDLSFKKLDEFLAVTHNNETFITTFAGLYTTMKNDKDKTLSIYEKLAEKRDSQELTGRLIASYNDMHRKDDVKKLVNERIEHYPYFNSMYSSAITLANNDNNYEEALKYSNTGLKNFPYSFELLEEKGRSYNSLKNTKDAEKYFREALVHHSGNNDLRKTLYDITKVPDELEEVVTKDVYTLIKQRRNSKMASNYGLNILLDEYIVNILPEGGRKTKITYVYEVVAENGVEGLKEYEINGNNLNVIKAEIVKPDGSLVPGEQNYGTVVFTNLKVGDVVHVCYETTDNSYGRFYRDFTLDYYFNSVYPSKQTIFGIIYPEGISFANNITNGTIPSKTRKIKNRTYIYWEKKDTPAIPLLEDFAPNYNDLICKLAVSSIKSWSEISNWYADLVKKNIKMDNIAIKTYNEIFPKGTDGLKQEEIAYRIYKYIEENITYSSLDFRQSGYVPQKPSKTITTKLGDCKDVSTLFVAMAERAGLKANLVLVQTNDNGIQSLKLPSISFNHCIVKVIIDGKEHFLEMTDKYLPFKALPTSLYKANALVISFDKAENEKSTLINIPFTNALPTAVSTVSTINIDENSKKFDNIHTVTGAYKAYYNELFSESTTADVRKKEFEDDFNDKLSKVVVFEDAKLLNNDRFLPEIKYETKFSVSEKLQSVGSLKIFEIPYIDRIYTKSIINTEKRNYDINYSSYENINHYNSEVIVNIPEGKKFMEVPQNHTFAFKGHKYSLTYEQIAPNKLKVVRDVDISWDNVSTADYAAYKKYVEDVIAAEEEIIGFK